MFCQNCLCYGHTKKRCNTNIIICGRCAVVGHPKNNCRNDVKCFKCGEYHYTGSRQCNEQKLQQTIINIQTDQRVDRRTAALAREIHPKQGTL